MAGVKSKLQSNPALIPDVDPLLGSTRTAPLTALRYLSAFAMTAIATVVAVAVDTNVTVPNLSLVFVVPVIIAAVGLGLGPSLCSAVLGALAFNFFLTEPRYTLRVDDPANIWAIGLLFVVGLIASGVAFTSRRRATDATQLRKQAAVLQDYSRDIMAAGDTKAIVAITSKALAALFQVPVVVLLMTEGEVVSVQRVGSVVPQEAELEAARTSLATGLVVRAGAYPAEASRYDFWPVAAETGPSAAIGLAFDPDERPQDAAALVGIVGRLLALALDRQHLLGNRETSA